MSSLRKQLGDAQSRMAQINDELEAVGQTAREEGRDLTQEDEAVVEELTNEFEKKSKAVDRLNKLIDTTDRIAEKKMIPATLQAVDAMRTHNTPFDERQLVPARVRNQRSKHFDSTYECYQVGQWLSALCGNQISKQWCLDKGMVFRNDMEGGTPNLGGYTVPDPMAATIIRLVEEYGVFRRFARNAVMTSDTLDVPKRSAGLAMRYPSEGDQIIGSDLTFAQVNLVAKKYAQLAIMSTELNEDSIISMTDLITTEMAWNFALAEDTNSFIGDGSAAFGGITGILNALQAGALFAGPAGLWANIDLTTLEDMAGAVPEYSGLQTRWYMSRYAYFNVVVSLLNVAGGTDMRQIEAGGELMLFGSPVTFTQVLAGRNGANGELAIVFGDLNLGSYLGTRRSVTIRVLNELYAASDQIGMVGTMRSDTQIHDVGDATNAGCIVGLTLST